MVLASGNLNKISSNSIIICMLEVWFAFVPVYVIMSLFGLITRMFMLCLIIMSQKVHLWRIKWLLSCINVFKLVYLQVIMTT